MFDTIINGAQIIDGTGAPSFSADLAIRDGKLTLLPGGSEGLETSTVIDAVGLCVCPGFIDAHSHGDILVGTDYSRLCKSSQGITTEVCGQCGSTYFPITPDSDLYGEDLSTYPSLGSIAPELTRNFAGYRRYLESRPKTANIKQLVGHNMLRHSVMGSADRRPTAAELDRMKGLLRECMEEGAMGFSTGLVYPPSGYADEYEVTELCKVLEPFHGIYSTHMRNEGNQVVEAVAEAIRTARNAGVRLDISHHKISGKSNWGKSQQTLALIDEAIADGQEVALDVYPYTASLTDLSICLPLEELQYPLKERMARLRDKYVRADIEARMKVFDGKYTELGGLGSILLPSCPVTSWYNGKTIGEIAEASGKREFDVFFDLLLENRFMIRAIFFSLCEEDLCRIFMHEHAMVGSDGVVTGLDQPTHPRGFGTFPRAIHYFVREKKLLTLEEAIRKMTSFTADWLMLDGKGVIRDGYDADLVLFDPETIAEGNSYLDSLKTAVGIRSVFVDGKIVYQEGALTGACPGRVVLHGDAR